MIWFDVGLTQIHHHFAIETDVITLRAEMEEMQNTALLAI